MGRCKSDGCSQSNRLTLPVPVPVNCFGVISSMVRANSDALSLADGALRGKTRSQDTKIVACCKGRGAKKCLLGHHPPFWNENGLWEKRKTINARRKGFTLPSRSHKSL